MSVHVVHEPTVDRHVCGPGWVWHEYKPFDPEVDVFPSPPSGHYWRDPYDVVPGTVVECDECGVWWTCVRDPGSESSYRDRNGRVHGFVMMPHNVWVKETPKERRKRDRGARRAERRSHAR